MVWRYILAFVLSIALLFGWQIYNANNPQVAPKAAPKGQPVAQGQPPGQAAQGAIGAAKPAVPASGSEKPEEKTPAVEQKDGGFSAVWKDGLGSLDRVLKDGAELAVFGPSGGGLALSVFDGKDGWRRLDAGWKAIEEEAGSGWAHELQDTESFKVTRRVAVGVTGDGILRLDVSLEFENNGTGPVRYRLGGGFGRADGFAAASRVEGSVETIDSKEVPWLRKGKAKWVALRRGKKLAVFYSTSPDGGEGTAAPAAPLYADAALVNADGVFLERRSIQNETSKHRYELAIGSNDPRLLEKYRVEGDLSRINRSEVDLSDEIRVEIDSGRGTLSKVWLRKQFTAVKDKAGQQKIQPVLVDPDSDSALLGMGPIDDSESDSSKDWGGSWSETVRELANGGREIIFEKRIGSVRIRKKISPAPVNKDGSGEFDKLLQVKAGALGGGNLLRVSIELTNLAEEREEFPFILYGPSGMLSSGASSRFAGRDIELALGKYKTKKGVEPELKSPEKLADERRDENEDGNVVVYPWVEEAKDVAWAASVNAYFTALMFPGTRLKHQGLRAKEIPYPADPADGWWPISNEAPTDDQKSIRTGFKCGQKLFLPPGGNPRELAFGLYIGPRVSDFIESGSALDFEGANDFGTTSPLIHFFMAFLNLLQKATFGNWGLAIILLTVIVKLCLHPITRKNQRGMMRMGKAMAKIKPEMEILQAQYGTDKMKYSAEVQKLWKKHNVNPAKQMLGCLVIFLQMPIWIGIIWSLEYVIGVRQASFLYILDLTKPDDLLYSLWWYKMDPDSLFYFWPFYGQLNILPILYVVLTMVNQKMQPRSEDPQAAAQQKMMGFMMIFFGFIFYGFASGFMLYIMTSAALGIAESKIIKAQLAREDLELEGNQGGEGTAAPAAPLYKAKNKSAEKIVPSSAKKKKRRKRF